MPSKKKSADNSSTLQQMPALSSDIAALLNSKIAEFEKNTQEENEKSQKAQKGRFRALAKTKIKEAKALVANTEMSCEDKARSLWTRLLEEHEQAQNNLEQAQDRVREIADTERDRDAVQAELNKGLGVKNKLESLCRQLQQQTNDLIEERRKLTEAERQKRQELADEFQHTISDVKKKMDQQANERARLARENEDLRNKFKQFFERYDKREKEFSAQQQDRDLEVQAFERRLSDQAQLYRQEAAREAAARRENEELVNTEQVLRGQLQTYSNKFNHFQDALKKSHTVLGQHKRKKNKMQRQVEVLEKENAELRIRNGKREATLTKERNSAQREKEELQERCKQLQAERQQLNEEVQKLQTS